MRLDSRRQRSSSRNGVTHNAIVYLNIRMIAVQIYKYYLCNAMFLDFVCVDIRFDLLKNLFYIGLV